MGRKLRVPISTAVTPFMCTRCALLTRVAALQ